MFFNKEIVIPKIDLNINCNDLIEKMQRFENKKVKNATIDIKINNKYQYPINKIINTSMSEEDDTIKLAREYYLSGLSLQKTADALTGKGFKKINKTTIGRWAKKYDWDNYKGELEKEAIIEAIEERAESKPTPKEKEKTKKKEQTKAKERIIKDELKKRYSSGLDLLDGATKAIWEALYIFDPEINDYRVNPELKPNQVLQFGVLLFGKTNELLLKMEENIKNDSEQFGDSKSERQTWADLIWSKV